MNFTVKLADKNIQLQCITPEFKTFCQNYIVDDAAPDLTISWTHEDIRFEQENTESNFSYAYLETLAALRKIAEHFSEYQRILMHGASIAYNGKAYLFTAPSGTGKSTHIRLWRKYLGEDVAIVNGDKPFISLDGPEPRIYGSPWAGKENWQKNHSAPLKGICCVQRGTVNCIRKIDPAEYLPFIMKQIFLPNNAIAVGSILELIDQLLRRVPLYILECDISEEAVRCSFEALTGLSYPHNK